MRRMRKQGLKSLVLSLLFCHFLLAKGQQKPDLQIQDVLASFQQDSLWLQSQNNYKWFEDYRWRTTYLRQLEFRTETDNFNINRQEYTLRASPRGLREAKLRAQRQLEEQAELVGQMQLLQVQLLRERYHSLVQYYLETRARTLADKQKNLLKEKIQLLALAYTDNSWDPVDLAKAETDYLEQELQTQLSAQRIQWLQERFVSWAGASFASDYAWEEMISIPEILFLVRNYSPLQLDQMPEIQKARLDAQDALKDWETEKAQHRRLIDYYQIRLRGSDNLSFSPEISLGLGLTLPLVREDRNQLILQEIQWRSAQDNLLQTQQRLSAQEQSTRKEILDLIESWQEFQRQIDRGHSRELYAQVAQIEGAKPLRLALLQEQIIKQEALLMEVEKQVYLAYLKWLEASGFFAERLARNYLSGNRDLLLQD